MTSKNDTPKPELLLTVNLLDYMSVKRAKEIIQSIEFSITPKLEGISVNELELTVRASNCLSFEGIDNISQLCSYTEDGLYALQNLGKKTIVEIKDALSKRGLKLKGRYEQ